MATELAGLPNRFEVRAILDTDNLPVTVRGMEPDGVLLGPDLPRERAREICRDCLQATDPSPFVVRLVDQTPESPETDPLVDSVMPLDLPADAIAGWIAGLANVAHAARGGEDPDFLQTFVDTIPSPAFHKDGQARLVACNAAFSQIIMGLPKREMIGLTVPDFRPDLTDIERDVFHGRDMELIRRPGPQSYEASITTADGETRDFVFHKTTFLDSDGKVLGICGVMTDISERKSAERELQHARSQEISIGRQIQMSLLLGQPPIELAGVDVAARSIASQQIDGDFYDFLRYDEDHFDVLIGDVMGKGVSAALLGAAIKTQFVRAVAGLVCSGRLLVLPTPEGIVQYVHDAMSPELIRLNSFATGIYARFDLRNDRVIAVNFGHTNIAVYRAADETASLVPGHNLPLGFSYKETYRQSVIPLSNDDVLVLYSDGLVEARSRNGEEYGAERLLATLAKHADESADAIGRRLQESVASFHGGPAFSDDLTYVVIRRQTLSQPAPAIVRSLTLPGTLEAIGDLRQFLRTQCDSLGLRIETFRNELEIGAVEVFTNIVRHAYADRPAEPVRVMLEKTRRGVTLQLHHTGQPLERFELTAPPLDGSDRGGLGLYMISQCVDEVRHETDPAGRAVVRLVKRLPTSR